jgi:hypothetical protein
VWDDDEDAQLLEAVDEIGEGKWKAISERLGNGRKDSAVSNSLSMENWADLSFAVPCKVRRSKEEER